MKVVKLKPYATHKYVTMYKKSRKKRNYFPRVRVFAGWSGTVLKEGDCIIDKQNKVVYINESDVKLLNLECTEAGVKCLDDMTSDATDVRSYLDYKYACIKSTPPPSMEHHFPTLYDMNWPFKVTNIDT